MKRILATFAAALIAIAASAAVTITTSSKTFQKAGGAASVVVQGDGAWTATADTDWIVIRSGGSGNGAGSCVYVVNANATADVRIGHINIGGNTYTITQYGYDATISSTSATFDRHGGSGSIAVTVDAGVSWSAVPNDDWIAVSPTSGTSVGTVNYTVAEYPGVVSRVGSITIGGKTFTINQTGVDVSISPESVVKEEGADILAVTIHALATTQWTVTPNDPWISIIDKETGYGDYVLTLAINANPSFERRTGTVSIGTATLTISQAGTTTAALSIDPATATASASGAYGNVAVYATPDAAWTAESLSPWLTISEGATGAGNGNIKYVASANPTLSSRTGQIVVTPPHKVIEPDLYRGLLFWITDQYNVEGNESRKTSVPLSTTLNGSQAITFSGANLPTRYTSAFSFAVSFKVGELNRINRLFQLGRSARHFYLDANNSLHYDISGYPRTVNWSIPKANTWYTIAVSHEPWDNSGGILNIFIGEKGKELVKVHSQPEGVFFNCNNNEDMSASFKLGQTDFPSSGYLTSGQFANVRFWTRALTDTECELVDVNQSLAMSEDDVPLGAPAGVKWDYFPLDGNAYRTKNTSMAASAQNTSLSGWTTNSADLDRYGGEFSIVASTGNGKVTISNFQDIFGSTEKDATYSFWVYIWQLPSSKANVFKRSNRNTYNNNTLYEPPNSYTRGNFSVSLSPEGNLTFDTSSSSSTTFSTAVLSSGEWHQIAIVGKSGASVQMFVDGVEIGNVSSSLTLGYYRYNSDYTHEFTLGGWNGAADGLTFFHSALTSAQVRELYERQRPQKVVHTVTQGVQIPQLNKSQVTAPAEGCTESVALTLAQSVQWTAQSNNSWIQITSDAAGAGSANVSFTIGANPAVTSRSGSITVAGKTVTVVQEGLRASVECDDTSFGVESDSGTIWVETEGGGTWTASADVDWIHLFDESGTGTTPVMFVVDDYTTTTASRSGTVTIAGHKVVITQQGYELSIDPAVAEVGSNAGAGQFGVSAPIDAVWEAIADCDWITIIGARTGIGDGVIQYTIADNTTGETRTGRIVIAGKAYTITQKTTLPVTTKAVGSGTIAGAGDYNQGSTVTLTATPSAGYVFSHWSGDAVGVTNQVTISVDSPKDVTATFIPESAAEQLAAAKAAQGGFYTRDQMRQLALGDTVIEMDGNDGNIGLTIQLQERPDLGSGSWQDVDMHGKPVSVDAEGRVHLRVPPKGNSAFYRLVNKGEEE